MNLTDLRRIVFGLVWLYGVFAALPTLAWWFGWPVWPLWVIVGPAAIGLLFLAWARPRSLLQGTKPRPRPRDRRAARNPVRLAQPEARSGVHERTCGLVPPLSEEEKESRMMRFFLGTHMPNWLERTDVPLFVSRRRLTERRTLPQARADWALDSGGFTELSMYGEWRTSVDEYVADVRRFREIGGMEWVAPQDWMCEPFMLEKTGLTVEQHQERTVENFLRLRDQVGALVIPVLQGWTRDDYHFCWAMYEACGVDLEDEPVVGLGSVCRRQDTSEAGLIVRSLIPLSLHYFGAKITGLTSFGDALTSADSMAWSYQARRALPLPGCTHKSCANCPRYAMRWRSNLLERLGQQRMEIAA